MFEKHRNSKADAERKAAVEPYADTILSADPSPGGGKAALIGAKIQINGEISGEENLIIEGKVDGKVSLDAHRVEIGRSGQVNANVTAKVVKIAGKVRGDLMATEKVVISSTGNVHGNIVTPRMTLEDGAIFKGSIDMDPGEPAKTKVVPAVKKDAEKTAEKNVGSAGVKNPGKGKGNTAYSLNGG